MQEGESKGTEVRMSVRGLDPELWRQLRIAALKRGVPVGTLLNQVVEQYLEIEAHREPTAG